MSKAGDSILAGLQDAIKDVKGYGRSHDIDNSPINKKVIQDKSDSQIVHKKKI